MPTTEAIETFLTDLTDRSGRDALSEAKRLRLRASPGAAVVVAEGDEIVAVAVPASHQQPDGSIVWELETAVRRDLQFPEFEQTILSAGLEAIPGDAPVSVWSSRASLTNALVAGGFTAKRSLAHMVVKLPLPVVDRAVGEIRTFGWDDLDGLIAVNADAFANHPEAGGLDAEQFRSLARESWFSPSGILITPASGSIVGYCWTKVHDNRDGEIYRIAVHPDAQGRGLGRHLTIAGFAHLAQQPRVERGTLWVDRANAPAVRLYEDLGMNVEHTTTEYLKD